jgi:hypothetical protein
VGRLAVLRKRGLVPDLLCRSFSLPLVFLFPTRIYHDRALVPGKSRYRKQGNPLTGKRVNQELRLFVKGMDVKYTVQEVRWAALSDARVPRVPIFRSQFAGAQTFAELFEVISDCEAGDVFDVLVAELAGNPHAQRSAKWHRQLSAVLYHWNATIQDAFRFAHLGDTTMRVPGKLLA